MLQGPFILTFITVLGVSVIRFPIRNVSPSAWDGRKFSSMGVQVKQRNKTADVVVVVRLNMLRRVWSGVAIPIVCNVAVTGTVT